MERWKPQRRSLQRIHVKSGSEQPGWRSNIGQSIPSQWAAIESIADMISCTEQAPCNWVRQAGRDQGLRPGVTSEEQSRIKALEQEAREPHQANEMLRKASAHFAQAELDRRLKP